MRVCLTNRQLFVTQWLKKAVLTLALAFALAPAFAQTPPIDEFRIPIQTDVHATMQGIRYANPGGVPIILFHGLSNNTRVWREMARALHARGYDVWMFNFRSHGQGSHVSAPEERRRGRGQFRYIVTEDIPTAVDYVFEQTGQRAVLMGHSTGGMAITQYERGVVDNHRGGLRIDPRVREERARRVRAIIPNSAPVDFETPGADLRFLATLGLASQGYFPRRFRLPFGWGRAPTEPDPRGFRHMLGQLFVRGAQPVALPLVPRGVMDLRNFTREEVQALIDKGFSDAIGTELLLNFGHWIDSGRYEDPVSHFSFIHSDAPLVPRLDLAGELDSLAPVDNIRKGMRRLPADANTRMVVFSGRGHMDMASGESAAEQIVPVIHKFIQDPDSVAPRGAEITMPPCPHQPHGLRGTLARLRRR